MQLTTKFNHERYTDQELQESISAILEANNTLALSTVKDDGGYINTAHYGFTDQLEIYIITAKETVHSQNAYKNPKVAVAIWNRPITHGEGLEGLQLFGTYSLVTGDEVQKALDAYAMHTPGFAEKFKCAEAFNNTGLFFHKINVTSLKLIDESHFGRRNFISLTIQ